MDGEFVTYHRKPTPYELKFGYGATHYKDFTKEFVWNHINNRPKRWIKCPIDGLRYYY